MSSASVIEVSGPLCLSNIHEYDEKQYVMLPQPLTLVSLADDGVNNALYMHVISRWYMGITCGAVCLLEQVVYSSWEWSLSMVCMWLACIKY
jgi:hypothetical protein